MFCANCILQEGDCMSLSEKKKISNKRYNDKTYQVFTFRMKKADATDLDSYIEKNGIKSRQYFILQCLAKCIKEGYIPDDVNNTL